MLVTHSVPLRVSLLGGGTDLPENVEIAGNTGACLVTHIPYCVHAIVEIAHTDDEPILEFDPRVDTTLTHATYDILRPFIDNEYGNTRVRISMAEDLPTKGTGLGSSAAWVRANLDVWSSKIEHYNDFLSKPRIAYDIERSIGSSCGYQDHVAARHSCTNMFEFFPNTDGPATWNYSRMNVNCDWLLPSMCLIRVSGFRDSNSLLARQASRMNNDVMKAMADLAMRGIKTLEMNVDDGLPALSSLVNESWKMKREYSNGTTNKKVDEVIDFVLSNGGRGAKLLGAGGCGYVLALVKPDEMTKFTTAATQNGYKSYGMESIL